MNWTPTNPEVPAAVRNIVQTLESLGFETWCVGGALRDHLLGRPQSDFDVATAATPAEIKRAFRRTVAVGERFGTVGVLDAHGTLHEVTTFRRDVRTDGRHAEVEFGASLEEDLARRDFTINALAWHPERREWRDPYHGADDLDRGVVRAVGSASDRFTEDYLRILRALRFAARLAFAVDPPTWAALVANAPGLDQISAERVRDEWFKSLESARDVRNLVSLWHESRAAAVWLPELCAAGDVPAQASATPRDPVLLTTILCEHGAAVLQRLRCSNAQVARADALARLPEAPAGQEDRAVRQWMAVAGASADDLLDRWAIVHGEKAPWAGRVDRIRERGEPVDRGALAVNGSDLVELGYRGPAIGAALDRALQAVLDDPTVNDREQLLALVGRPE